MRMAPHQLFSDRLNHVTEIETAGFLGHSGAKYDLKQKVAQLVAQVVETAARNRGSCLIGRLDRIGRNGREILLQVPGAPGPGRAQRRHDLDETGDVAGGRHAGAVHAVCYYTRTTVEWSDDRSRPAAMDDRGVLRLAGKAAGAVRTRGRFSRTH